MPIVLGGAVVAIDVIMVAVMALLLTYSLKMTLDAILYGLGSAVEQLPDPLSTLGTNMKGWADVVWQWAWSHISGWIGQSAAPSTQTLDTAANSMRGIDYSQRHAMVSLVPAIAYLASKLVGGSVSGVTSYVQSTGQTLAAWAQGAITTSVASVEAWVTQSYSQLGAWAQGEIAAVNQSVARVDEARQADVRSIDSYVQQVQERADTMIATAETQAEDYATTVTNDATNRLNDRITTGYDQLAGSITQTQDWTKQLVTDVEGSLGSVIAAVGATVTTVVLPRVATLEQDAEECFRPTCNGLLGFSKGFGQLENLIGTGLFLAWLAELVANPEAGAERLRGVVAGPTEFVEGTLKRFFPLG